MLKRIFQTAVCLALFVFLIPVYAYAEGGMEYSELLDAAFDADSVVLERMPQSILQAGELDVTDEVLGMMGSDASVSAEMIRGMMAGSQLTPLSLSPAGNSGLFELDGTVLAFYNGVYRFMIPSLTRGVPDENGNLSRFISRPHPGTVKASSFSR